MKHQLVILFILALTSVASAQSTAFTYQGHLMDAGATVGTPQAVSPVTAVNGIFGLMLDFGSVIFLQRV